MTNSTIDLDELERLEREATPGPWDLKGRCLGYNIFAERAIDFSGGFDAVHGLPLFRISELDRDGESNLDLLIALRNAAPAMIAELRAARERIVEMRRVLGIAQDALDRMMGDSDLDGDNSLEMRAMKAIASTLEESPNAD